MTDTEALKAYEEIVGITGWPEWKEGRYYRLRSDGFLEHRYVGPPEWRRGDIFLTTHERLCIWRDWVRVWLEKHGIGVASGEHNFYGYDAALIAAVKAVNDDSK